MSGIQGTYEGNKAVVQFVAGLTKLFHAKFGQHQELVLSPFLLMKNIALVIALTKTNYCIDENKSSPSIFSIFSA